MSFKPKQRIPEDKKDQKWFQATAEYYIHQSSFTGEVDEIAKLQQAIDGIIDEEYYAHVTNPYNSEDGSWDNLPAKLKSFNIIEPVVMSIIGELGREPDMVRIVSTNPDSVNEYNAKLAEKIRKAADQDFVNQVNAIQQDKEAEPVNYVNIEKRHATTFKSRRTIMVSDAWDYLSQCLNYRDIRIECAYDYLTTGRAYTYKYVDRDQVYAEVVPPNELTVFHSPTNKYVGNSTAVVRRRKVMLTEVVDKFRDKLEESTLDDMEKDIAYYQGLSAPDINVNNVVQNIMSTRSERFSETVLMYHVQFIGQRRVGILHYTNEIGMELTMEVLDSYQLQPDKGDIKLEYEYINWAYEIWRFGENTWTKGEALDYQRHEANNMSVRKLNYDGIINRSRSGKVNSIVKSGMVYQALFNIYRFRMEMTMAANKDKIMLLPLGLKPKNWSFDKWLYNIAVSRIAFIDDTNDKIQTLVQAIKDIDLSLGSYIGEMIKITEQIKSDWWDSVGFNRQRLGGLMASDGKATTGEAIYRSSLITSEYLRKFASFEREDVRGLLDYSKFAWRKGKHAQFNSTQGRNIMLEIEGQDWQETVYDIFVKNSASETEKVDNLKQLLQPMAQNNASKKFMAAIIDEDNFEKIKSLMEEADEVERQFMIEQEKQRNEATKYAADQMVKTAELQDATKRYEADKRFEAVIESTRMKVAAGLLNGAGRDGDGDGEVNETEEVMNKVDIADIINKGISDRMINDKNLAHAYEKIKTDRMKIAQDKKEKSK